MTLKKLTVTLLLSWLERLYNGFILSDAHDISCQFHILQCPSFSCGSFKVLQKDFLKIVQERILFYWIVNGAWESNLQKLHETRIFET